MARESHGGWKSWCVFALTISTATAAHAASTTVPAGGNLQLAIDAAQPGDTILLQPGAVYTGAFILPAKGGAGYITIRTAPTSGLPGDGARIAPSNAPLLAKLRSGTTAPALRTDPGAHHWRVMLVEMQATSDSSGEILRLGDGSTAQYDLSQVPHDLIVDRVYLHGDAAAGQKRGIALNSASTTITGCYVADIMSATQDSQAIAGWNGPGPYIITNNYLEAAGENVLFGGADPSVPNLVPSNITITNNLVTKRLAWRSQSWRVKNLLELKNARHVSVMHNTFEYTWQAAQTGYAILFTVRNQGGGCRWCQVDHVRFEQNVVRHSGAGFQIMGYDYTYPSQQTNAIEIRDNLFSDIDPWNWGGNGYFLTLTGGAANVAIDHNTIISTHASGLVQLDGPAVPGFSFTNNLARHNAYGFIGTNHGVGNDSINYFLPGAIIQQNVLAEANANQYPSGNWFPTEATFESGFLGYTSGDYRIAASSGWQNRGLDGRDLGAAANIPGTIQAEHFNEGGEGVGYHDDSPGNWGGAYWPSNVDIERSADGGYDVGWIGKGEWLCYDVTVASAGVYQFEARVAAPAAGAVFHLEAAGRDVTGPVAIPATGWWQTWTTVSLPVQLDAGQQTVRLVFDQPGANVNWIRFSLGSSSTPPVGISLPGVFQAADYDAGGEGIAYHDDSAGNWGGQYRTDDVDIERSSLGGYDVGWIAAGEWLNYTVNVTAAGSYTVGLRVASPSGASLHLGFGGSGSNVWKSVAIPATGGWQNWTTVNVPVTLAAGPQMMTLLFDTSGLNVGEVAVTQAP